MKLAILLPALLASIAFGAGYLNVDLAYRYWKKGLARFGTLIILAGCVIGYFLVNYQPFENPTAAYICTLIPILTFVIGMILRKSLYPSQVDIRRIAIFCLKSALDYKHKEPEKRNLERIFLDFCDANAEKRRDDDSPVLSLELVHDLLVKEALLTNNQTSNLIQKVSKKPVPRSLLTRKVRLGPHHKPTFILN